MDWIFQAIKEDIVVKAFNKIFGNGNESSSNSSLLFIIFFFYIYLIAYIFIISFYIIKFFYYTIPKYLITKYRKLPPKKKAFTRILILPLFILIFTSVIAELLAEKSYDPFFVGLAMFLGLIFWWVSSIKKYKKLITLEEKERVHYLVNKSRSLLKTIKNKSCYYAKTQSKNIYAWGIIVYFSTFSLYSRTTPLQGHQERIIDIIYYNIII